MFTVIFLRLISRHGGDKSDDILFFCCLLTDVALLAIIAPIASNTLAGR